MTEVNLVFKNCTSSDITFSQGTDNVVLKPGMHIEDKSSTNSYSIIYNNKSYPIDRKYINMLVPQQEYEIIITDSISLLEPTFRSFYTCNGRTAILTEKKAVVLSLEQGIMLTNGTTDGEWTNIDPKKYWIKLILVVMLIVFIILTILIAGVWLYKKFSKTSQP